MKLFFILIMLFLQAIIWFYPTWSYKRVNPQDMTSIRHLVFEKELPEQYQDLHPHHPWRYEKLESVYYDTSQKTKAHLGIFNVFSVHLNKNNAFALSSADSYIQNKPLILTSVTSLVTFLLGVFVTSWLVPTSRQRREIQNYEQVRQSCSYPETP